jgi:hypothetical protein
MLRDPGRVPTGFLRSRHGPYVPSRNRNSQLREPAGRYGTAVTVGGMLAEAGTTCPRGRAPSGCVCALSRPRWERLSQSAIWNGRIALSALRPAGDRCREMQACSTLVHHITSMRGVAPYKRQTQLHEHRRQNQNPQIRYSADSTVSQASRPGCGEGNRYATPRNRPGAMLIVLQAATPAGVTNGSRTGTTARWGFKSIR